MSASPYVDSCTDLQGRTWYVNDRILHRIPGVRSDAGKVAELFSGSASYRAIVQFDDGGRVAVYLSECVLIRRRTADEIPYAALDPDWKIAQANSCGRHYPDPCGPGFCQYRGDRYSRAQVEQQKGGSA